MQPFNSLSNIQIVAGTVCKFLQISKDKKRLFCGTAKGLCVVNISNPLAPFVEYTDNSNNSSIYFCVSNDEKFFAFCDQNSWTSVLYDISIPNVPVILSKSFATARSPSGIAFSGSSEYLYTGGDSGINAYYLGNPKIPIHLPVLYPTTSWLRLIYNKNNNVIVGAGYPNTVNSIFGLNNGLINSKYDVSQLTGQFNTRAITTKDDNVFMGVNYSIGSAANIYTLNLKTKTASYFIAGSNIDDVTAIFPSQTGKYLYASYGLNIDGFLNSKLVYSLPAGTPYFFCFSDDYTLMASVSSSALITIYSVKDSPLINNGASSDFQLNTLINMHRPVSLLGSYKS